MRSALTNKNESHPLLIFNPGVYLVGAGPGAADLITVRGAKILEQADIVFHDALVEPEMLALCPQAILIPVGKRCGKLSSIQGFINKRLVDAAHKYPIVVRLKGGDPFIFGRGGEEVEHLRQAGIEVTVINGITSGLAAISSLGAPLTHREHAHGVVFVTGHAKPGDSGTDWRQLAATARDAKLTLVIYMGVSGADHIQTELLTGLPADTPVAIIENASLPEQRQALTRLDRLTFTLNETGLKSPSILVVGNVVQACAQIFQTEPSSPTLPLHANM